MKKFMIAGILVLASPLAVQASSVGCGVGSQIFKGQTGVGPNIMAATTNGSSGNQTFGISSGTLGCNAEDAVPDVAGLFIDQNMERVARDMSTGQGEALETLATLMGIQDADKVAFYEVSQSNFTTIFSRDDVTSSEVIASLNDVMTKDSRLSKYTV
jgi:hypothetical protein